MKRLIVSVAFVGLAAGLMGCVYYPNGPYGPGYGPPPRYGAPPPGDYGPQPGQQPPPGYGSEGGPPPQGGYGDEGAYGPQQGPNPSDIAKMNDPNWCAAHPHHCKKLQKKYGAQGGYGPPPQQGGYGPPPQQGGYGPPPQQGSYGPPPNQTQGPPPGDDD